MARLDVATGEGLEDHTKELRPYKCSGYVLEVSEQVGLKKAVLIKTTVRYHFTPTRMVIIKKTDNWNPPTLLLGM